MNRLPTGSREGRKGIHRGLRSWSRPACFLVLGILAIVGSGCLYAKNRVNDFFDIMSIGTGVGFGASARATHYVQAGALLTGGRLDTQGFRIHPLLFAFALQAYRFPMPPPPPTDLAIAVGTAFSGIGYVRSEVETGPAYEIGAAPLFHFRSVDLQETGPEGRARMVGSQSRTIIMGRTLIDSAKDPNWKRWYDSRIWSFYPGVVNYINGNYDRRFFDLGASAYLGVGIDLDLDLYELADFFLGLFTIDFARDDGIGELPEEKEDEPEKG